MDGLKGWLSKGLEHTRVFPIRRNLADCLHCQGQYAAAEELYRALLSVQRRDLGDTHPDTLSTANDLACVLQDRGDLEEAQAMFEKVLAARRRVLGPTHPGTMATAECLAGLEAVESRRSVTPATPPATPAHS